MRVSDVTRSVIENTSFNITRTNPKCEVSFQYPSLFLFYSPLFRIFSLASLRFCLSSLAAKFGVRVWT